MLLRPWILLLLPVLSIAAAVPEGLQALADQARGLPPEFAADVLLRLAESPLANDAAWKRRAIEDAFVSGGWSTSLYARQGDERPGRHLDSLTLQTRAVEAVLPLDPQKALTMFRDIPSLSLPKIACRVAATPDVSPYYSTALALFTGAFTPAERAKEADIAFLRELISAIQSPSQVVPALKLLDQVEISPQPRASLVTAFAVALDRVDGDDREFGASEPLLMGAAVPEMHEALLLPALRAYIVRQVSGARCSDRMGKGQLPESATQFNKLISRIDPHGTQFHPITAEEAAPLRDDGTYPATADRSARAKQVAAAVQALGREQAASSEWAAHYDDALRLIESWNPEEEASPSEYSHLVAANYVGLLDLVGSNQAHGSALTSALHFLEEQYHALSDRGLWWAEFQMLFGGARLSASNADKVWMLDRFVHSSNPVIATYAQMEKLLAP